VLCFDIAVNGTRYCVAGVGERGTLSAFVTYYRIPPGDELPDLGRQAHLNVSGTRPDGSRVQWASNPSPDATVPLRLGDVVTIRVIDSPGADRGRAPL
jgi:hypothetical protein